jgi:DNA modification methylase
VSVTSTEGFTDCGHNAYEPGVVLDPFAGSGTTLLVARKLGRRSIGIDLNESYLDMAAERLQQLSLLAEVANA